MDMYSSLFAALARWIKQEYARAKPLSAVKPRLVHAIIRAFGDPEIAWTPIAEPISYIFWNCLSMKSILICGRTSLRTRRFADISQRHPR
jgi:hypothetical protein